MKTPFLLLIGLLLACSASSQTPNCKKFRNGKFYYPTLQNKVSVRKDSVQESYNNGKLEMVWKVKWLSDCEYMMTCEKILVDPYPLKVGDRIKATIVKTEGDCFVTTIVYYNEENPEGKDIPSGPMCFE